MAPSPPPQVATALGTFQRSLGRHSSGCRALSCVPTALGLISGTAFMGRGGTCLWSQHSEGRGKKIEVYSHPQPQSKFEASLGHLDWTQSQRQSPAFTLL